MEISDDHDITVIYQIRSVLRRAQRFAGGCVKIRAFWGPGVLFAGLFAVSGSAQAANEIGTFDERFLLRAGLMYSNQDTQLRLDGDNLLGVSVDLEDFFNLDEALDSVVQIMGRWRFAERHRIGLEYYSFDRGAKSVLQQDWVGDNIEASAGATADTLLNIGIWDLSYTYSFLRESNYELSGTIGLFFMDVDIVVDLQGELEVGGVPVSSGRGRCRCTGGRTPAADRPGLRLRPDPAVAGGGLFQVLYLADWQDRRLHRQGERGYALLSLESRRDWRRTHRV